MNRLICTVLLAAAAIWTACDKNTPYEVNVIPTVDVIAGADIAFKAIGGKGTIRTDAEGQLEATTAQSSWCHLSVSGDTINVEVDEYDGLESRYAVIDLTAGKATGKTIVHQYGIIVKEYSWQDVTVKNNRQDIEFPYDADGTVVRVSTDQNWVTFDTTAEKMILHIAENPTTDYREARVHWSLGSVSGDISVGQFDLTAAGLLGTWNWHGAQAPNNRDFPMTATLKESADGVYTLSLSATSSSYDLALSVGNIVLQKNQLLLPLGQYVGTYTLKRTGVVYDTYTLLAPGTARLQFGDAISEGAVPFTLVKDETGQWKATGDMSAFPDMLFRFEMWLQPEEYEEAHSGNSSSGLALSNMYMVKN